MARTSITNNAAEARHFGWIPPHGRTLAPGQEIVIDGDLRTILAGGLGRYSRGTELSGFDDDISNGNAIVELAPEFSSSSSSA